MAGNHLKKTGWAVARPKRLPQSGHDPFQADGDSDLWEGGSCRERSRVKSKVPAGTS
jgi:hypothetical protein